MSSTACWMRVGQQKLYQLVNLSASERVRRSPPLPRTGQPIGWWMLAVEQYEVWNNAYLA
jgi:hypothetical protein